MSEKVKYIEKIKNFGDHTTRDYERMVYKFIIDHECSKDVLLEIIKESEDLEVRYGAFYVICTLMRRNKDYTDYRKYLETYRNTFKDMCSINHLESMYLIEVAKTSYEFMRALDFSEKAVECNTLNPGYLHSYAINVVKGFEEGHLNTSDENSQHHLHMALQYIKQAIEADGHYAKFYATNGRLCAIQGKFIEAKDLINRAIDLENSDSKDYAIRISDYRAHYLDVTFKEQMSAFNGSFTEVKTELERVTLEMEEAKTKNIEFLGFFTALISFTIGSIQILSNQTFNDAMRLIMVLCGSLLLVLGGFGIVLNGQKRISRSVIVWAMGIGTILTSFFLIK